MDDAVGNEVEEGQGFLALLPPDRGEEQREERGSANGDRTPDHGPGVQHARDAALVVVGDRVAARGSHELARVSFLGAPVGTQATAVTGPQFLAGHQVGGEPDLRQPDQLAGEHGVVVRQRADRRAVAATEAGIDVGCAELLQVGDQVGIDQRAHSYSHSSRVASGP